MHGPRMAFRCFAGAGLLPLRMHASPHASGFGVVTGGAWRRLHASLRWCRVCGWSNRGPLSVPRPPRVLGDSTICSVACSSTQGKREMWPCCLERQRRCRPPRGRKAANPAIRSIHTQCWRGTLKILSCLGRGCHLTPRLFFVQKQSAGGRPLQGFAMSTNRRPSARAVCPVFLTSSRTNVKYSTDRLHAGCLEVPGGRPQQEPRQFLG